MCTCSLDCCHLPPASHAQMTCRHVTSSDSASSLTLSSRPSCSLWVSKPNATACHASGPKVRSILHHSLTRGLWHAADVQHFNTAGLSSLTSEYVHSDCSDWWWCEASFDTTIHDGNQWEERVILLYSSVIRGSFTWLCWNWTCFRGFFLFVLNLNMF